MNIMNIVKEHRNSIGQLHSVDCPAIIYEDDLRFEWWINGIRHRDDGPAIEQKNHFKQWYINGQLHREDGPAEMYEDGSKYWCFHGKFHRKDGPAIEYGNGHKVWYFHNKLHREDGPAIEDIDGSIHFYWFGERLQDDDEIKLFDKGYLTDEEKTFLTLKYK